MTHQHPQCLQGVHTAGAGTRIGTGTGTGGALVGVGALLAACQVYMRDISAYESHKWTVLLPECNTNKIC